MKCSTVAIIGRPSAGKSTFINTVTERKVSITSPTPQTTRNAIKGIYTDSRGQLVFTDTPGFHLSDKLMNIRLKEIAVQSLEDNEAVLYMVDATREPGEEEAAIASLLSKVKIPVVAVLNKSDVLTSSQKEAAQSFLAKHLPKATVLEASALKDEGVDEVLIELFRTAPEAPLLYDEDSFTDRDLEFRISEIIREKVINSVRDEIPHAVFVEISDLEYDGDAESVWIRAFINVDKESQKGIVVGKGGENIKNIRKAAFKDIKQIFPGKKLTLDLRVKVQSKWRTNEMLLKKLID